ncbi:hypothetical protein N2152v2_001709 [Parachlorella kessleri]
MPEAARQLPARAAGNTNVEVLPGLGGGSDDELESGQESSEDECIAIDMFGLSGWSTEWWQSGQPSAKPSSIGSTTPGSSSASGSNLTRRPAGGSSASGGSVTRMPLSSREPGSNSPHAAAPSQQPESLGEHASAAETRSMLQSELYNVLLKESS